MKRIRTLFVLLLVFLSFNLSAQSQDLKKADKLYKLKKYADAMPFYKAGLAERESLSARTKLAFCYRMTNRMDSAETLYGQIVLNERANKKTYFYYGEALMSNSKYDEAKKWFLTYLEEKPEDEQALALAKACEEVKSIQPLFEKVRIEPFLYNSEVDDTAPIFFKDAIVFSSDRNRGMKLLKEKSGWTGRDFINLYISKKQENGTYEKPVMYSKKFNELNKNTGMLSFNKAGTAAYFTRNGNVLTKNNSYAMQLYSAESEDGEKWKKVTLLPFCNPGKNYMHPAISPDGKFLFFVSDKGGGEGGMDIFVSKKNKSDWGRPQNLGPNINTSGHEGFPYVANDSTLYFCSKGHNGYGGFDVFCSIKGINGNWGKPINVGKPINSSYDDISIFLDTDAQKGMFTSSRDGGDDDIYFFSIGTEIDQEIVTETDAPEKANNVSETLLNQSTNEIKEKVTEETAIVVTDIRDFKEIDQSAKEETFVKEDSITTKLVDTATVRIVGIKPNPVYEINSVETLEQAITSKEIEVGESFILTNIKYEKNASDVNDVIALELDKLIALMQKHPSLQIELSSHTPSIGHDEKNLTLSQQRVNAVRDYFLTKNISQERIEANGYGETALINDCANGSLCALEKHMQNQRIEVKVLNY